MSESTRRPTVSEYLVQIDSLCASLVTATARSAEYADLGGYADSRTVYRSVQTRLGRIAGRTRRDLTGLANHQHDWSGENDYCAICGADGRA